MSCHEQRLSGHNETHSSPRPPRRFDQLTSSLEFTPAKDVSARTSSFKRLSGSTPRGVKPDQISSVLSKPHARQPDIKLEANNSSQRGRSPCTPKRPRSQVKALDSSFDGLSPIGSPKQCGFSPDFEPMSTPKRRKSSSSGLRSSMGDFSLIKRTAGGIREVDSGLSKSVDFSKIPSFRIPTNQFSTPKKRPKSDVDRSPPAAPHKMRRSDVSLPTDLPTPTRLFPEERVEKDVVESTENAPASALNISKLNPVDYVSAMGIVGFISSHLVRTGDRCVPLSQLVQIVSAASVAHRTPTSALTALRDLARAVPEWVTVGKEGGSVASYTFSEGMRTSQVLQKLRELKRQQTMEDTADLRSSIAELRASLSDIRAMTTARQ